VNQQLKLHSNRESGQVIILFALFSFVLIGVLALALDVGYLMSERREAQAAADASALAGARALLAGESSSGVVAAAQQYATSNGLPSTPGSVMTVNVEGDRWDGQVTVDLTMDVQKFFVGALYAGNWKVGARAVAEITDDSDARYILQGREEPGISIDGGIQVTAVNGSIISNTNIETNGDSSIVITDGFIDAAGTIEQSSGWAAPWGIRERRAPAIDPFENYAAPPKPAGAPIVDTFRCNPRGYEDAVYTDSGVVDGDCLFLPGHYKNSKIRIWDLAVFMPGLYYFENTSIELRGTNARIEGVGVNFYFTGEPDRSYFDPNNGEVYLTAPGWSADPNTLTVHGDYHDIVLWFDMCPGPEFDSAGNQEFFLGGVLYAPCSAIHLHGNPNGETISGMVIGGEIHLQGASDMTVTYLPYGPADSYEIYLIE
jgi:hypothetical protein